VKCKYNNDYGSCTLKTIGIDNNGKCATCVLVNKKYNVIRNPMDEHTNMC
jgi:hypothetical protein